MFFQAFVYVPDQIVEAATGMTAKQFEDTVCKDTISKAFTSTKMALQADAAAFLRDLSFSAPQITITSGVWSTQSK